MNHPLQPSPNRILFPMMSAMRNCLITQLLHVERPVCYLPVIWGEAPLPAQRCDCECANGGHGEGWIRIVRTELVNQTGPRSGGRASAFVNDACGQRLWDITIETGVWRCALTLDSATGQAPSDADYDAHTQGMLNDGAALSRTWRCCQWLQDREFLHQSDTLTPIGPSGGCVGAIITGRVRADECGPCPQ